MLISFFLPLLILLCTIGTWYFLAIPLSLYYLYRTNGFGLLVIAILADGYYQAFYDIPWLSIGAIAAVVIAHTLKPRLLYTREHEVVS